MNPEALRLLQPFLNARYRQAIETAPITPHGQGCIDDGVSGKVETSASLVVPGSIPVPGGSGHATCSSNTLIAALVAGASVTPNTVMTVLGLDLPDASRQTEGDLDLRSMLGLSNEVPSPLATHRVAVHVQHGGIGRTTRYSVVPD